MASGIYEQVEWPESRWDCVVVANLLLTEGRAS